MTAVLPLPPIKGAMVSPNKEPNEGGMQTEIRYVPVPPRGSPGRGLHSGKLQPLAKKIQSKKERQMSERLHELRQQQQYLTKQDTSMYRNTYKHTLCLDMLQDGYHMSFRELFALIQEQEDERAQAGPDSVMWSQLMLHSQKDKLDKLKLHLTNAETAERDGDYATVYSERFQLAKYFLNMGDKWLSDHFFNTCLSTSRAVEGDGRKAQAEGHRNVGLALKESGDYFRASQHFEAYHELASQHKDWQNEEGVVFYTDACVNLYDIYTIIGTQLEDEDPEHSLELLIKAFQMASDSGDKRLEGESTYALGLAYEKAEDGEKALLHLGHFLEACRNTEDQGGIGKACDAIAKTYAREGKVLECIEYLKQFVQTAEDSGQEAEFSRACHNLGNVYNSLGRYEEATEYFSKAYNISRAMGETSSIHANRVQYGIAMAHRMLAGFGNHIVLGHQPCLERLIEWKSARSDEFEKPIPDSGTPRRTPHVLAIPTKKPTEVKTESSSEETPAAEEEKMESESEPDLPNCERTQTGESLMSTIDSDD